MRSIIYEITASAVLRYDLMRDWIEAQTKKRRLNSEVLTHRVSISYSILGMLVCAKSFATIVQLNERII